MGRPRERSARRNRSSIAQSLRESEGELKLVELDLLHTTLKFLGDTDEALVPDLVASMDRAVNGIPPLTVRLRGTGVFPSPTRINVIWVGLEGAQSLAAIAANLERECERLGFRRENRRWEPHVTIARVKGPRNLPRVRAAVDAFASEEFGEAVVDRIRLKRSVLTPAGPEYTTVAEVPLRP